jgi:hypothetical protein
VVHFEKGMTLCVPYAEHAPSYGTLTVTHIDRLTGQIVAAATSPDTVFMNPRDFEALRREIDAGYDKLRESLSNALYRTGPLPPPAAVAQVGIAATVALAGLGWIVARRNLLAGSEDSESWAKRVVAWFLELVRGLLGERAADA